MSEVKHEVLLQAKGIYKNFETSKKDQAVHALTNVDLTLYRGETLALVGESGCGKKHPGTHPDPNAARNQGQRDL